MEEAAGAWVLRRPRGHLCWVLRRRYIWGILEVRIDRAKRRVPPAGHVRGTVGPRAVNLTTALARGTVGPGSAPPASARLPILQMSGPTGQEWLDMRAPGPAATFLGAPEWRGARKGAES